MGYSGLIYAAIVAAWAAFLVPRWVRRNEEVERAREADAVRGVRVLQRKIGPPQAPHGALNGTGDRTLLHGNAAGLTVGGAAVPLAATTPSMSRRVDDVREFERAFAAASLRRRRVLVGLLVVGFVMLAGMLAGRVPAWAFVSVTVTTVVFLVFARRAVVAQAHARRVVHRRSSAARVVARSWTAGSGAEVDTVDGAEPAGRRLVIPDEVVADGDAADGWKPVPVPLPTYLTKAAAPRVARSIDLNQPGAWTSGRLDPASSIELPRRPVAEPVASTVDSSETAVEEQAEHRRAVGD